MADFPDITISDKGFSESETKKIFADAGLDWENRSERYTKLKGTIFEEIPGKWYIAYVDGKPLASQGIGSFEGVYLLLGAKSFAEKGTRVGSRLTTHVIDNHGDKPIIGSAGSEQGKKLFVTHNKFKLINVKDGFVEGNEDLPTEVKSALEVANEKGGIPIRKIYLKMPDTWFMILRKWMPPASYEEMSILDTKSQKGKKGRVDSPEPDEISVLVRPHYLDRGGEEGRNYPPASGELEIWVEKVKTKTGMAKGKYWFYRNDKPKDRQHIIIDIIGRRDKVPGTEGKVLAPKEMIVINTISKKWGGTSPDLDQFLDIWDTGIKEGQRERGRDKRRKEDESGPKNPFVRD